MEAPTMTTSDYQTLIVERRDRVLVVSMNRPERMNALSAELTAELGGLLTELAAGEEDVRCLVLTGAGRAIQPASRQRSRAAPRARMGGSPRNRAAASEPARGSGRN